MKAFEYANPSTREEVVELLQKYQGEAAVLAGGTDLLSLMKEEIVSPSVVVNIKRVAEAHGISQEGETIRIGALSTLKDLIENEWIVQHFPALVDAARGVASPQIQNMGTVGGDLCQRPRCWYYRSGYGLLAMKDGRSMVSDGDNRYHAILGSNGKAYFVSPSSLAPGLAALGARIQIYGPGGEREVSVNDFFRVPEAEGERECNLSRSEFVVSVAVPMRGHRSAAYEVRQREALDWPLAAAAVALSLNGQRVEEAAVVLGHVAPKPWMAEAAGAYLRGKNLSEDTAEGAGKAAVEGASPLSRNAYKVRLAQTAVKRALLRAGGMEVPG